jgi:hypothetical protein
MKLIILTFFFICRILPNGSKDICGNLHVPTPGRVQYYRAEALPFVPAEIKTQIRFPKAFAVAKTNLRYLDTVRAETQAFLEENVKTNYFDGSSEVPLTVSLGEAEVLYSTSDEIKALGESGELKQIHDNVANLSESAESAYINLKDRLMNIINAGHAKEDEICESLIDDHEVAGIRKHNVFGDSIFDMMSQTYKMASVENLSIVNGAI